AYLAAALGSIRDQTVPPAEVIVVDDGSTDGSGELAAACGARVVSQPPTGYASAVNRGVSEASGDVLAFLDADDLWAPEALACRAARLVAPDQPDVVVGVTQNFASPDLGEDEAATIRIHLRPFRAEVPAAALVRASTFAHVGPFDEGLRTGAAIDWISRARLAGISFAHVDDVVLRRRIHAANLGRSMAADRNADLLKIVRAHHARHRTG
ncbi:MAG TPA: glycosyltransferase, partial [Aquihabitans sp.]|nr:glycosyltransferase [Aquihabitans sp.]